MSLRPDYSNGFAARLIPGDTEKLQSLVEAYYEARDALIKYIGKEELYPVVRTSDGTTVCACETEKPPAATCTGGFG